MCVDVDAGGADSFVRLASGVEREWLPAERITVRIEVTFDEKTERLAARKVTRFDDLVLEENDAHIARRVRGRERARVRRRGAVGEGATAAGFRRRRDSARGCGACGRGCRNWSCPRSRPPTCATLLEWLCRNRRSLADVRTGPWLDFLKGQLTYPQLQAVEGEAPERIEVPSGSHITLAYEEGRPPVLAARIQEMFGLTETPRVARGRVKVLLHLLAPNYRPQQVTDDLASFWANGYPLVRKELRGRYPKHSWPDDPLTAPAVRGPKKRQ